MENDLELIDVDTIVKECIVPFNAETVRRYFRSGVLFAHTRKRGVGFLSYRGSVKIRYYAMEKVARTGRKRLRLDDVGELFEKESGPEDEFIVGRLREKKKTEEILKEFIEKVRTQIIEK